MDNPIPITNPTMTRLEKADVVANLTAEHNAQQGVITPPAVTTPPVETPVPVTPVPPVEVNTTTTEPVKVEEPKKPLAFEVVKTEVSTPEATPEVVKPVVAPTVDPVAAQLKYLGNTLGKEFATLDEATAHMIELQTPKVAKFESEFVEKMNEFIKQSTKDPKAAALEFTAINRTDYAKLVQEDPLGVLLKQQLHAFPDSGLTEADIRTSLESQYPTDATKYEDLSEDQATTNRVKLMQAAMTASKQMIEWQVESSVPDAETAQKLRAVEDEVIQKQYLSEAKDYISNLKHIPIDKDYNFTVNVYDDKGQVNPAFQPALAAVSNPQKFLSQFYSDDGKTYNPQKIFVAEVMMRLMPLIAAGKGDQVAGQRVNSLLNELENGSEVHIANKSVVTAAKVMTSEEIALHNAQQVFGAKTA